MDESACSMTNLFELLLCNLQIDAVYCSQSSVAEKQSNISLPSPEGKGMRAYKLSTFILLLVVLTLASCSSNNDVTEEPTRSSEDVIRTAEAIAEKTRQFSTSTPEPSQVPPSPTTIIDTATPEPTATLASPRVVPKYNSNVRSGPGEEYPIIDFFFVDQEADVIALHIHETMGTWWYIKRIGSGLNGWVWGGAVEFSGDASGIPLWEAPPTPTATVLESGPTETDTPSVAPTDTDTP